MPRLDLGPDELLSTTRAVRRRLDLSRSVDTALVRECLELAIQAPTGSNAQGWHFVLVTDADKRARIGALYRQAFALYRDMPFSAHRVHAGDPSMEKVQERVVASAEYLAEHLHEVPVFVIPCVQGRVEAVPAPMAVLAQASTYASIIPAAWSFMLAARARGLGTCWTTLHLMHEQEVAELLGIPHTEVTQVALIPVAHTRGTDFRRAPRKSLEDVLHLEAW